ncbi:TOMM system kinase/cyclase fusion protein [Archangium gephyra]|uniref:Adenylate cyclase n=1 Tax=Archangium gephyra TaxID=48 RepID=A0AAC8TA54_9BACT|nr:TOMM system kinase/cyclase fusion protein [Archangium gephyra]AKI98486.1 Adenylate cyclase [Archangium gephyra]REG20415.1 TOMM system kinase/cyclase fusion protein [Archangium gephyra]
MIPSQEVSGDRSGGQSSWGSPSELPPPPEPPGEDTPSAKDSLESDFGDSFLEQVAALSTRDVRNAPLFLPPGTRLGGEDGQRFELLTELGTGAMGQVFRAKDLLLERTTAIKFLLQHESIPRERLDSLFLTEARATARLDHENIVRIFDVGTWKNIPYLVIEYLRGRSLQALLKQERLEPLRAVQLLEQIATGLAHAHQHGIIHRDLKPSNVFVLENGRVKLLDFGLAHLIAGATPSHLQAGTPAYMAPEQWRGEPQDGRTDIWAAGVILFEMLTGELPYQALQPKGLRAQVTSPEPVPPARARAPELREELDQVLQRALHKDPDLRFQSAEELRQALRAVEPLLAHPPAPPPLRPGAAASTDAAIQRRQVTLLSARLGSLEDLPPSLTPDDLSEVLETFHHCCILETGQWGGTLITSVNDQLLICFGCRAAKEDDAERAVRAAEHLLDVMKEQLHTLGQSARLLPQLGLHTGPVTLDYLAVQAQSGGLTLQGAAPTIASALASRALPGTVLVSEQTYRLVRGIFATESLGPQPLEGCRRELDVHRVLSAREVTSRFERASGQGLTPLVGRTEELASLLDAWSRARSGQGQLLLLVGEAGMGKSRVVQALRERLAGQSHTHLTCQCWPQYKDSAFYPVLEVIRRAMRLDREKTPEAKLARLEQVLAALELDVPRALPLLAPMLSVPLLERYTPTALPPRRLKEELLQVLAELLLRLTRHDPVLLVVEDLHWVDPSTLQLLTLLQERIPTTRTLLVLTARSEFRSPLPPRPWSHQLWLERLSPGQTGELVREVAQQEQLPRELLEQLVARTDGVPLFVEELTRMMLELCPTKRGLPERGLDQWLVPITLQDLLAARLDRLPPEPRQLAQVAAVLGRSFTPAMIAAVSGWEPPALQQALATLLASGLLHKQGPGPELQYQFRHALIRDAAYQSLPRSQLRQYHRRVAEVLAKLFPETAQGNPELLAYHQAAAGQYEQAIHSWAQAGTLASQRSTNQEAVGHFQAALRLVKHLPDPARQQREELRLQIGLGNNLMATRGYGAPEVERAYSRAHELCTAMGDTPQLSPALHGLWLYYFAQARFQKSHQLAEQLLGLGRKNPEAADLLILGHRMMGTVLFTMGEPAAALEHFQQTLARYDRVRNRSLALVYGIDPAVAALSYLSWIHWYLGSADQAWKDHQAALRLAKEVAHPHTSAFAYCYASSFHQLRRESADTLRCADKALVFAREHHFPHWETWATLFKGQAMVAQGMVDKGLPLLRAGIEGWRASFSETGMATHLTLLAESNMRAGRHEDAQRVLEEAFTLQERYGERCGEVTLHRVRGELLLATGAAPEQALASFHQSIAVARRQGARALELQTTLSLCRLLLRLGEREKARTTLEALLSGFTEGWETPDQREARELSARLG